MIIKLPIRRGKVSIQSSLMLKNRTGIPISQPVDNSETQNITSEVTAITTSPTVTGDIDGEMQGAPLSEVSAGTGKADTQMHAILAPQEKAKQFPGRDVMAPLPRLAQGRLTLEEYAKNSGEIAKRIPSGREIEFVVAFIKGIRGVRARKKLTEKLMAIHPSTTKSNNEVEVICTWPDVEDGLRRANLALLSTPGVPSRKKKRVIIPPHLMDEDC